MPAPHDSHRLESESSDARLRCPKDGTLMEKQRIGGKGKADAHITIDRCAKCGALWMDAQEMEQILSMDAVKQADLGPFGRDKPNGPSAPLNCPRDHSLLVEVADKKQMHVLIMLCTKCGGKLLDAGELTDLSEFTMAERLRAALKL